MTSLVVYNKIPPTVEFLIATMGTTCLGKCFLSIQFLPQLVEEIKQTRQQLVSYGLRMQPDVVVKKNCCSTFDSRLNFGWLTSAAIQFHRQDRRLFENGITKKSQGHWRKKR